MLCINKHVLELITPDKPIQTLQNQTDQHPDTDDSHSDGQTYRHLDIQTDSHKERQISRNPKIHAAVLNAVGIDQGLTACMAA